MGLKTKLRVLVFEAKAFNVLVDAAGCILERVLFFNIFFFIVSMVVVLIMIAGVCMRKSRIGYVKRYYDSQG